MGKAPNIFINPKRMVGLKYLSLEQKGKLLDDIMEFYDTGVYEEDDTMVLMLLDGIVEDMLDNEEHYEEVCAKRSEAGKKGGRPKTTNDTEAQPAKKQQFIF